MKVHLLSRKYLAGFLAICFVLMGEALAAPVANSPEITRFEANPVDELSPGVELVFRMEGTPKAKATVTVSGIKQPINLRETDTGFYEGSYTLRQNDRLPSNPNVRATLRHGKRAATTSLSQPLVAVAQAPARGPEIQRFTMEPERIEPGMEIVFTLEGTPSANATFSIANVARGMTMTEVRPGVYEGRYTVRRQDTFSATDVTAALEAHGQVDRARLAASAAASARQRQAVQVRSVKPREGERVTQPVTVSGTLNTNVDPRSVRIFFADREVTQEATVTPSSFTYQPRETLLAGTYRVEVMSQDSSGNSANTAWTFQVQAASAQAGFPLEITSPSNMAQVRSGPIEVRGRSAPNLPLSVQVEATTSVAGLVGLNRNILSRTVTTDERGNFAFSFEPSMAVPGTQYEVNVSGTWAGQEKSRKLTLVQQ